MPALPTGTLTMLFSDIEGSTSMLTGLGSLWPEALSAHRAIMRAAFEAHGGTEMGTEGDSFFVVFPSAHEGVLAAVEAQRGLAEHAWPGDRPLRVRIGLHTGEPEVHEDSYVGLDVHRAARIAATAHGGQTVISAATHVLATGFLDELVVTDLGWHRLKDLGEPEHLYDVAVPGLAHEHPPLRSLGMSANLPAYATELVGRSVDLQEVAAAISGGRRLVTLTGTGGTGKTRLAVAVAAELESRFPRDIFFVPLHTAQTAALMWDGIADAVGAPGEAHLTPRESALAVLRGRAALLVLDNLEQIPDADVVVSELLNEAPGISLLATSRRPLHLVEEQQYPVAALTVPEASRRTEEALRSEAVQLFVQRARLVKPGFMVTDDNVDDVVTLCRRLDGLPLAIELAAARARLLSPRALVKRIDGWLGEGVPAVDRVERQRTLAAAISWSYDLLSEEDQRVFRRLGVFASRVGLDAVERVVTSEGRDPLDVVAHLVDVSLLEIVEGPDGEPMIFMLETVRRFARDRLEESGELEETRLRHGHWCVEVATVIAGLLTGPRQMTALDRMDAVEEEIRAALDWAFEVENGCSEQRCACGFALLEPMDQYWYRFGRIAEGREWHERAMRVIDTIGGIDDVGIVDALHGHGVLAVQQNDLTAASRALERSLAMAQRLGDLGREARESNSLGVVRRESGDVEGARALIERGIELARLVGDARREANGLGNILAIHMDAGDYPAAVAAARRAAAADEALGDPWGVAVDKSNLVVALLFAEGPGPAIEQLVEVAPVAISLEDTELSIEIVDHFAAVLAATGDGEGAATMLGSADRHREEAGIPRPGPDQTILDRFLIPARAAFDPPRWSDAYDRGRALTVQEAVAEGSARGAVAPSHAGTQHAS